MELSKPHHRKRRVVCCSSITIVLVAVAVIIVALSQTVYKVKEPKMTINSFSISLLNLNQNTTTTTTTNNITVVADASVKNPNSIPFKFGVSTTALFYRGGFVGEAYGPAGATKAHGTFRANVTFDLMANKLLDDPGLVADLQAGSLAMETSTRVGGRAKLLGLFGRHVDVVMNCTVNVSVSDMSVLDQHCTERVWL